MSDCLSWSQVEWEESEQKALSGIRNLIKEVPDFPKIGINFRDVMPVFLNANATKAMVDIFVRHVKENYSSVEGIVGLESRGFMIGTMVALRLHIPFIPIRKVGKLPGKCISISSTKEYGADIIQMQENALRSVNKVIIIDDLLATGGTLRNSSELVVECGGEILCCMTLSEIIELNGRDGMKYPFHSFIQYSPRSIF